MLNLRVVVAWFTDDGNDVKPKGRVDVLVVEVIGDGLQKVELLLDRRKRISVSNKQVDIVLHDATRNLIDWE